MESLEGYCSCFDSPCLSGLTALQKPGPPGAPSVWSRGPGNNPPAGVATRAQPEFGPGVAASRESDLSCVSAGQRGFASAFLYSHFLKQLAFHSLHRKDKKAMVAENVEDWFDRHVAEEEENVDLPLSEGDLVSGSCRSSSETPCSSLSRRILSCSWVSSSNCSSAYRTKLLLLLCCHWNFQSVVLFVCTPCVSESVTHAQCHTWCGDFEIGSLGCSSSSPYSHRAAWSALHGLSTCGLSSGTKHTQYVV